MATQWVNVEAIGGVLMLSLPPTVRIFLAAPPTDLRKSFDSLAAVVREGLRGDPLSGDIFVFRNKAADRIKLLVWEEDGYALWYKRLEAGSYRFPSVPGDVPRVEVRAADLVMLLAGVDLASVKRGKRYHRPVARAAGSTRHRPPSLRTPPNNVRTSHV